MKLFLAYFFKDKFHEWDWVNRVLTLNREMEIQRRWDFYHVTLPGDSGIEHHWIPIAEVPGSACGWECLRCGRTHVGRVTYYPIEHIKINYFEQSPMRRDCIEDEYY